MGKEIELEKTVNGSENKEIENELINRVYTTGQASKVCNLSQQTIIICFEEGKLEGFYVPGSKHRRILHRSLVKFMKENNMYEFFKDNLKKYS